MADPYTLGMADPYTLGMADPYTLGMKLSRGACKIGRVV
jgi:hypothetical protein